MFHNIRSTASCTIDIRTHPINNAQILRGYKKLSYPSSTRKRKCTPLTNIGVTSTFIKNVPYVSHIDLEKHRTMKASTASLRSIK
jgi:hypothetical protein